MQNIDTKLQKKVQSKEFEESGSAVVHVRIGLYAS
jgi:hypothetical protein